MLESRKVTYKNADVAVNGVAILVPAGALTTSCKIFNKSTTVTVYFTEDGSVPSATNGYPLAPLTGYEWQTWQLPTGTLQAFSGAAASVFVSQA